jgi:Cytoskeletal-regulatory complex EF hand
MRIKMQIRMVVFFLTRPFLPSSGSGSTKIDWAIQGPAKLRYTQLFNTTDRNRSGYLTGTQARNIMVQTKLPQAILAQIWALSDMDSDGRLGCEEFVLAMYLCDLVSKNGNDHKSFTSFLVFF